MAGRHLNTLNGDHQVRKRPDGTYEITLVVSIDEEELKTVDLMDQMTLGEGSSNENWVSYDDGWALLKAITACGVFKGVQFSAEMSETMFLDWHYAISEVWADRRRDGHVTGEISWREEDEDD